MNIGTYSLTKQEALLWLVTAAVFVAFTSFGIFIYNNIMNGLHDKQRLYQTAIKTKNGDEFNYSIDTKQGNVMTYGTFHFVDFVKFPEMNKSFSQVTRTEEEYTRHEHEECDTDDEGNETDCETIVEYSWDYNGSESVEGKTVNLFNREYSTSLFSFNNSYIIEASSIISSANDEYWYPSGDKGDSFFGFGGASVGDIRYQYSVRDKLISGSIFVNTYRGLHAAEGDIIHVHSESIEDRVKKITTEAAWASGGFVVFWILVTITSTICVTFWWHENVDY